LAYFSALKMEATCSSETSADFQRITRHCIPGDNCLQPPLWEPQILNMATIMWSLFKYFESVTLKKKGRNESKKNRRKVDGKTRTVCIAWVWDVNFWVVI
jgi:hypothetical protein